MSRRFRVSSGFAFVLITVAAIVAACGGGVVPVDLKIDRYNSQDLKIDRYISPATNAAASPRVYVTDKNANTVSEFAFTATGNVAPLVTIAGKHTMLDNPIAIGFDASRKIYVLNAQSYEAFRPPASGNVSPKYLVAGSFTQLSQPVGMAVDSKGTVYVTNDGGGGASYITVYAPGSNGNRAPAQTIYDVTSPLFYAAGVAVHGDLIYVADPGDQTINEYLTSDNGDVSPANVIDNVNNPDGVWVDAKGLIYVTSGESIVVYAANATGNATPLRTISGGNTLLNGPAGLTAQHGVIAVANENGPSVTEYKLLAGGDAAPLRDLTGGNTGFLTPSAAGIQ